MAPNSLPTKTNPITRQIMLRMKVITDTCTGMKLTKIIARPVMLPKMMLPGIIKK